MDYKVTISVSWIDLDEVPELLERIRDAVEGISLDASGGVAVEEISFS